MPLRLFIAGAIVTAIAVTAAMPFVIKTLRQRANSSEESKLTYNQKSSNSDSGATTKMPTKRMSEEDIVRLLKEGQEKGYISKDLPSDSAELQALAKRLYEQTIDHEPSETEVGSESGEQQLVLMQRPSGEWNQSSDRLLPLSFEGREWSALFGDVLHAQDRDPLVPDEDFSKWLQSQRLRFQESIPEYVMLGRIWDTYIDVSYDPEEILQLREECVEVRSKTKNPVALRGLNKLIAACDEALKEHLGLCLVAN